MAKYIQKKANKIVYCDACKFEWPVGKTKLVESEVWRGLHSSDQFEVTYFCCPKCGKEYIVIVNNAITKSIMQEIRTLEDKIRGKAVQLTLREVELLDRLRFDSEYEALVEKRNNLMVSLTNSQNVLEEKFITLRASGQLQRA